MATVYDASVGVINPNIISSYDVSKPQISSILRKAYGDQNEPMFRKFESMGRLVEIAAKEWSGYEDTMKARKLTVDSVTVNPTSAGIAGTIVLDSGDVYGSDPYYYYPRVGELIWSQTNFVPARIYDVTNSSGTISVSFAPLDALDTFGSISGSDVLVVGSMAKGYQTNLPEGRRVGQVKRTHSMQLFKDSHGFSNDQQAEDKWFTIYDDGGNVEAQLYTGIGLAEYHLSRGMDMAFTMGKMTTNTHAGNKEAYYDINGTATSETGKVYTTKGYIPETKNRGYSSSYSSTFDIDDFFEYSSYSRSQYNNEKVFWFHTGHTLNHKMNTAAKAFAVPNADMALISKIVKNPKYLQEEMAVNLNFQYYNIDGYTYTDDVQDLWSDPNGFGAEGYGLDACGWICPLSKIKDNVNGKSLNNIEVGYRGKGGYNRKFYVFKIDGNTTKGVDRTDWGLMSEMGLGMYAVNQYIYVYPA